MGIGKTESTQTTTIPGMGGSARRMQELLLQAAEAASGQLGAEVSTDPTAQQMASIRDIQEATGGVAMSQMQAALEQTMGQVEGAALERGIPGSSIESVMQAINARDVQRQMNEFIQSQAGQAGEMALNTGFQNANIQLNRNQQLLQQLLGSTGQIGQADLQARLTQTDIAGTQDVGAFGAITQLGSSIGSMIPGGGGGGGGGDVQAPRVVQ